MSDRTPLDQVGDPPRTTRPPRTAGPPGTARPHAGPGPPDRGRRWLDRAWLVAPSLLPGLAMLVLGRYQVGTPSLGWDENATLIVSRRTPGQILDLVRDIDGSIAPYYLFMHWWSGFFGTSEMALRTPSIIAMALGVGLVGELGRRLFTPGVGLLGGLLLAAVPQLSRYAQDARVYGITFMLVALSTLLLYRALDRPGPARWCGYAVTVTLVGLAHLIGLTMLAGHAFAVARRWRRERRRPLLGWLPATAAALVPVAPLALLGLRQRGAQLDWIEPVTVDTIYAAAADTFAAATVAWLVIGLAFLARWPDRGLLAELTVLAAVPPVVLLGASLLTEPLWVPRYVLFALGPVALLAAVALYRFPVRAVLAAALVAVLAWPAQVAVRGPATHHGPSFRQIARIISTHQRPGDGIVYGGSRTWSLRAGVDHYLTGRPAPRDVLLARPAVEVGGLAAQECADPVPCLGSTPRVWLIRLFQQRDPLAGAGRIAPALRADYDEVRVWRITKGTVALYERRR